MGWTLTQLAIGVCSSAATLVSTIGMLCNVFARNGLPDVMVSDNSTVFNYFNFAAALVFCKNL